MNKCFYRAITLGVLGLVGLSSAIANTVTLQQQWLQQEQQHIVGLSAYLVSEARAYQQHVTAYCAKPSDDGLLISQSLWRQNYLAYLPLQASALGPLVDLKLNWALSYWPDKKDTTGRKVKAALAGQQPLSSTHSNLRSQEFLLFEALSEQQRCVLLPDVVNQYVQAAEQVANNLPSDLATISPEQLSSDVLNSYRLQTSIMLRKLRAIYSAKHQRLRPYQGEAWRAKLSAQLLAEQLTGLARRYQRYLAIYLTSIDANLAKQTAAQFALLSKAMPTIEPNDQHAQLSDWAKAEPMLAKLDRLFANQVPQALSIELGFNNNDGD
ncbi:hypothetical protein M0C34_15920 [Agarivorans sp. TSD2052]|uniref:imelysin family protein n=1 Tax=Agarivorans sp. TSD2052 TaxID=2937286 RepID=UPI00200DBE9B|nr:imelysin family protein [Agarivorans sp. TSD2052]UPW17716.1 hypothetical protein M0C34_15920 [Agarivorans sp. TSD2052]